MPFYVKDFIFIPHSASKQAPLRYFAILGTPTPCADREKIVVWSSLQKKNCSVFPPVMWWNLSPVIASILGVGHF